MSQAKTPFHLTSGWRIDCSEGSLIISGGADALYEVELGNPKTSIFTKLKPDTPFTKSELNSNDQRVFEQLAAAEIIVPVLKKGKKLKITVMGEKKLLDLGDNEAFTVVPSTSSHDMVVFVRSSGSYSDFLVRVNYYEVQKPHLFIDMAFHHTVSVGPFVFPGETACVGCLYGRVKKLWGDEAPPQKTQVANRYKNLAAELLITELERIAKGDTSLTNKTVAWNMQDRSVKTNMLLKVSLCPMCGNNKLDGMSMLTVL